MSIKKQDVHLQFHVCIIYPLCMCADDCHIPRDLCECICKYAYVCIPKSDLLVYLCVRMWV